MPEAQTVGTRALVDQETIKEYCGAIAQPNGFMAQAGFTAEQFADLPASELDALIQTIDTAATATQTSKFRLELNDAFCLRRDLRYSLRSRKWLFARGQQTRINNSCAAWVTFVREHLSSTPYLKTLIKMNARDLENLGFTTVMKG